MIRVKLVSAGRIAALALFITIAVALTVYLVLRSKREVTEPDGRLAERDVRGLAEALLTLATRIRSKAGFDSCSPPAPTRPTKTAPTSLSKYISNHTATTGRVTTW